MRQAAPVVVATLVVLVGFSGPAADGQQRNQRKVGPPTRNKYFERKEFAAKDGSKLIYYLMRPKDYDEKRRYPLVLALHGRGGNTTAAGVLGSEVNREKYPCFVMAPMSPRPFRWGAPKSRSKDDNARQEKLPAVLQAIEALQKELRIDAARIYVTGQSMGGAGSFAAVAARPNLFAAAVPVCGGWDGNEAPKMAKVPFWIFHGADDKVVPVARSREMVAALKEAGAIARYTEYEGVRHNSWVRAYDTAELWEWLFAQRRAIAGKP